MWNPTWTEEVLEARMRTAFNDHAKTILDNRDLYRVSRNGPPVIGLEEEVAVYVPGLVEGIEAVRDEILRRTPQADVELGAAQIEFSPPPHRLDASGFEAMKYEYLSWCAGVAKAANSVGAHIIRCGTNPFLPVHKTPRTVSKEKYQIVPDYQNRNRRVGVNTLFGLPGFAQVDIGDASIVSILQAFQVNIEALSIEDAIQKMNYGLMIGPYILALSGNARFLELNDTGVNDLRIRSWEISHDTRTTKDLKVGKRMRVGLPERYFSGLEDYFSRIQNYPFILNNEEHALQIGIGIHWLDTRLKFPEGSTSAVVEFRLMPTQADPLEEISCALFFVGRLIYAQSRQERLLPFGLVRQNRCGAIEKGMRSVMWFEDGENRFSAAPAPFVLAKELEKARFGFQNCGLDHLVPYLEPLLKRVKDITSPSSLLKNRLPALRSSRSQMEDVLYAENMLR